MFTFLSGLFGIFLFISYVHHGVSGKGLFSLPYIYLRFFYLKGYARLQFYGNLVTAVTAEYFGIHSFCHPTPHPLLLLLGAQCNFWIYLLSSLTFFSHFLYLCLVWGNTSAWCFISLNHFPSLWPLCYWGHLMKSFCLFLSFFLILSFKFRDQVCTF